MAELLSQENRSYLLMLARQAILDALAGKGLLPLDLSSLPKTLQEDGATFVTLTRRGELRGCVGTLEPYLPLAEDVREHAVAAAIQDYRFPPVQIQEMPEIKIEISRLTHPNELTYEKPDELVSLLRPNVDGVILRDDMQRATFLPQVWEKIPQPEIFLNQLCQKMGAPPDQWKRKKLRVYVYQVEEFHEP